MKYLINILKSDLTYISVFLSLYLMFFLHINAGIFFVVGFTFITFTTFFSDLFNKYKVLYLFIYLFPLLLGFSFFKIYDIAGFIIGSTIAGFMLGNFYNSSLNGVVKKHTLSKMGFVLKSTAISQILFTLYFFYNLIIQDIRGQNKLTENTVLLTLAILSVCLPLTQILLKKLLAKRVDTVSYYNIIIIASAGLVALASYFAFFEIGFFNTFLPSLYAIVAVISITAIQSFTENKKFLLSKTLTTLCYVFIPLTFIFYLPFQSSKYLGILISTFTIALLMSGLFIQKKQVKLDIRVSSIYVLTTSLYLILMGFFSLSTKGIIAKINIANVDYLLLLLLGIFLIMFLSDINLSTKYFLKKYYISGTYSVFMISLATFVCYTIIDLGGIEGIGSFLFGIVGFTFLKNSFLHRHKVNQSLAAYSFVEGNLVNLLTVLTLALILVKV